MRRRVGRLPWVASRLWLAVSALALAVFVPGLTGAGTATAATTSHDTAAYVYDAPALLSTPSGAMTDPRGSPSGPVGALWGTSLEVGGCTYDAAAYVYDAPACFSSPEAVAAGARGSPEWPGAASWGRSAFIWDDVVAANNETTTLFRSVGPGEAADIAATGTFNNPASINVKYFATSADDAVTWGNFLNPGESTIVTTKVPTSALEGAIYHPRWDSIGPAWILDTAQLGRLNQAMNGISVVR
jgi:hypothetical protein